MNAILRALIIEDSEDDALIMERFLRHGGFEFNYKRISSIRELHSALLNETWDLILSDYVLPGFDALEALEILKQSGVDIPFIIISGKIEEETAIRAMKAGAHDFIMKHNLARLVPVVQRELVEREMRARHRCAELERLKSEERYKLLAESITDVLFALDLNLICTYWNKAAEELTGIDSSSAVATPFKKLFPEPAASELGNVLSEAIETSETLSHSFYFNVNSLTHYFEATIYPTDNGLSVIARDITERKRAEDLQRAQEEMKIQLAQAKELRLLGQLTSGVAHEVRNPLNAISVVIEALFQELGDTKELSLYKEHIFAHVDRLKKLMQALLELGKPVEHAKMIQLNLYDFVMNTMELWKCSSLHNSVRVNVDSISNKNLYISGEPLKLQQVFMNVFENAIQHSEQVICIDVILSDKYDDCCIQIIDYGRGIKPEHIPHIFEPFFTTRRKGTGLGLCIVKHIIEEHGGSVSIQNNHSHSGCVVEIRIPSIKTSRTCCETQLFYESEAVII